MKILLTIFMSSLLSQLSWSAPQEAESVPGEYIIKLKPDLKLNKSRRQLESLFNARIKSSYPSLSLITIKKSILENKESVFQKILNSGLVEYIEPNYIYRINKIPSDSKFKDLWGMKNTGQRDSKGNKGIVGFDINIEKAWDIHTGSKNMIVAVIDTGIDFDHPDLKENLWTNLKELNGKKGVDDDNNGVVDDIHGFNAITGEGNAEDDHGHGSHCAGTIGGKGDNQDGVAGVNWNISLMSIKFMKSDGTGSSDDAIKGIDYALKMGAKVLSNSWSGGGYSLALYEAIRRSKKAGVLFVAAAGNNGQNNDLNVKYPSNYNVENVLSVAAINNRGALASFSNYGVKNVDLAAPGVNIISTTGGSYDSFSGTSMATPHVAGVAALVWSREPTLTVLALKARLMKTVKPVAALKDKVATGGMIDAYSAMTIKK